MIWLEVTSLVVQVINFNIVCSYVQTDNDAQLLTKIDPIMSFNFNPCYGTIIQ